MDIKDYNEFKEGIESAKRDIKQFGIEFCIKIISDNDESKYTDYDNGYAHHVKYSKNMISR